MSLFSSNANAGCAPNEKYMSPLVLFNTSYFISRLLAIIVYVRKKSNSKGYFSNVSSFEENLNFRKFSPFPTKSKSLFLANPCLVVIS